MAVAISVAMKNWITDSIYGGPFDWVGYNSNRAIYFKDDGDLVVEVEIPRYGKDEINASVDSGVLVIDADNGKDKKHLRYRIGEDISAGYDLEKAKCRLENGVLSLRASPVKTKNKKFIQIE